MLVAVTKIPNRTTSRTKDLFWLRASEGLYGCLPPAFGQNIMEAGTFEEEAIHFIVDRKQRLLKVPLLMTTFSSQALSPKISRTSQNSSYQLWTKHSTHDPMGTFYIQTIKEKHSYLPFTPLLFF
jgi:hypothetical protein